MTIHIQRKPGALLAQKIHLNGHQLNADGSTATNEITTAVERAA